MVENDETAPPPQGNDDVDPLLGKILDGRFRLIERLGAGGMGTVYKAVQAPLDRLVALKILNTDYDRDKDPGFQRRFFLEASVTSKLRHPNTITVIDYGKTSEGIYYLAMEFVEGKTVLDLLRTGPLPWRRALAITQQICRSLREAHRAGVIHRDLKPANVMVCADGSDDDTVKVLDFGLVKSFQTDATLATEQDITQAGVFLGSPQYMAPEQARNIADPRSDLYSLGVVLYQMLVGRPPFSADQSIDVIVKHIKDPPPPMNELRPGVDVPPEVEALVFRCLEKDPDHRFQSMEELLEAIRGVAAQIGVTGMHGAFTPPPMSQSSLGSGPRVHLPGEPAAASTAVERRIDPRTLALDISEEGDAGSAVARLDAAAGSRSGGAEPGATVSGPGAQGSDARAPHARADAPDETGVLPAKGPPTEVFRSLTDAEPTPRWIPWTLFLCALVAGAGAVYLLDLVPGAPDPTLEGTATTDAPADEPGTPSVAGSPGGSPEGSPGGSKDGSKDGSEDASEDGSGDRSGHASGEAGRGEPARPGAGRAGVHGRADAAGLADLAHASPATVRFVVSSEPEGAEVTHDGRTLGRTPLELEVPRPEEGAAIAELRFTLDGFMPRTVTARGLEPEVTVRPRLSPRPTPSARRAQPTPPTRPTASPRDTSRALPERDAPRETAPVETDAPEDYKDDPYR